MMAGPRNARAIPGACNVSTIVGRRVDGATAGLRGGGGSRMGVRRGATTARGCRTTVTNCPAKRNSPLPITLGGDVLLEPARVQPSPGRQRVNARTFQARRKG